MIEQRIVGHCILYYQFGRREHHVDLFFFQAEDGIRDRNVTGVQTCALPIYTAFSPVTRLIALAAVFTRLLLAVSPHFRRMRSEEHRVGEECRSWWWAVP